MMQLTWFYGPRERFGGAVILRGILDRLQWTAETDEMAYFKAIRLFQAQPHLDLRVVRSEIGLDAATQYAQLQFNQKSSVIKLKKQLDRSSAEIYRLNSHCDVIVVPPPKKLISAEIHRLHLQPLSALVTSCGFRHVSLLEMSVDSVLEGARKLERVLEEKQRQGRPFILISQSFGSAMVRALFSHWEDQEVPHLRGWLNLSGLIFGSPLFHCSDRVRLWGSHSLLQRSFSSEQRYFSEPVQWHGVRVVHALGLRWGSQLSRTARSEVEYLKAWGPNDGVIPFAHYQQLVEPVLALAGEGHWISIQRQATLIAGVLSSFVSTLPERSVSNVVSNPSSMRI